MTPIAAEPADRVDRHPVTELKGVGPQVAERLARLGIHTIGDALLHLPLRYEDRTRVSAIGELRGGETASVEGEIELAEVIQRRRRMLVARLTDGTGAIMLRFFHFRPFQQAQLVRGARLRCYGEVRGGPAGLEMVHPEYRPVESDDASTGEHGLTPIYPSTEGLHQLTLRSVISRALDRMTSAGIEDPLPDEVRRRFGLPALDEALLTVHRPPPDTVLDASTGAPTAARPAGVRRLAFEELLAHQLSLARLRDQVQSTPAPALVTEGRLAGAFRSKLAFRLTAAQERVVAEVGADLAREVPMLRLVQGDVGSGKTVVAALAVLQAVEAGRQAALMAPTELLAEQHHRQFESWLAPLGVRVEWVVGSLKGRAREAALARVASGESMVAVGTHALFQEHVAFASLGLVVVDEQHRFGVHQRLALRDKGAADGRAPHQLIMTATPIPRTLAMTAYADLDTSMIDELPPGRTPVQTVAIPDTRRDEVTERVRAACREGRQAYWVCNLIEQSEALEAQAAAETAERLRAELPELRVALVHGRMRPADKDAAMAAFQRAEFDLLVATTVIEVGVDVPNASLMIIDNAERFGLAQLHQLRGRVGRGRERSACVLLYHGPLSDTARQRLAVLRETTDGFEIARRDLELRGPGEVLGTRQTGLMSLRIADLARDRDLLGDVQSAAERLRGEHPGAVEPIIERWLGESTRYAAV